MLKKYKIIFILLTYINISSYSTIFAADEFEKNFESAKIFKEKKQFDRAITQLMIILEKSQRNIQARIMIGDIKFIQMNYEEAYDQVRYILKINNNNKEAIELGNKIFYEALKNRDFDAYRNFIFYACNYIFNSPQGETEKFIIFLLDNHKEKFINSNNRLNQKGDLTINTLCSIYTSFQKIVPVLTKYFSYQNIDGSYTARSALSNLQEEEKVRKNFELLKNNYNTAK